MSHRPLSLRPEDLLEHLDWARALARKLVVDSSTADDVVQESFASALRTPPAEEGPLRPWLARVLGNAARQRARGEGRRAARERHVAREEALPSAAELTERAEAQHLLMEVLLELDEARRQVVMLRYFEGLSSAEIARRQGIPAATVRSRLKLGLDELRTRLDRRFGDDRESWHHALAPLVLLGAPPPPPGPEPPVESAGTSVGLGLSNLVTGALWMKIALYASATAVASLLLTLSLVATGLLDWPLREAPLETVRFVPLEAQTPAPETPAPETGERVAVADNEPPPAANVASPHVQLRFVDEERRPVAGVVVGQPGTPRGVGSVTSGFDGHVVLPVTRFDNPQRLAFSCPGFANDTITFSMPSSPEMLQLGDVLLHAGGAISGHVVDESGAALPDVRVSVQGRSKSVTGGMRRMSRVTDLGAVEATTDEEGAFRLEGVLAGEVRVEAESEDELYSGTSGRVRVQAGSESTGLVVVATSTPADLRIEGRVLDPEGNPVPWAPIQVRFSSLFWKGSMGKSTDHEGRFRIVFERSIEASIEIRDPERRWNTIFLEDVETGRLDLTCRFETSEELGLLLTGGPGTTEPIRRAAIGVRAAADERVLEYRANPLEAGSAAIHRPKVPFFVVIEAPGFDHLRSEVFDPATLEAPLRFELTPLPGLRGRVVVEGIGVAGAQLTLQRSARQRTYASGVAVWLDPDALARGTSEADGSFTLTVREPGRYYLRAEVPGLAPAEHGPFDFDPGRGLTGVELILTGGGSIEGRALRADGLRKATIVLASRGDGHAQTVRSDLDGHYRFDHLMPGPWQVRVVEEELSPTSHSMYTELGAPIETIDSDCFVAEGETTRWNPGSDKPATISTVNGQFEISSAASWRAELVPADTGANAAEAGLSPDGRFTLHSATAGRHLLTLRSDEADTVAFLAELDLDGRTTAWRARVELGELIVDGMDTSAETATALGCLWRGESGLWAFAMLDPDAQGVARLRVPTGEIQLVEPDLLQLDDPRTWPVRQTLRTRAGRVTRTRL